MYRQRPSTLFVPIMAQVLTLILLPIARQQVTTPQANCQTFTETGKVVCGKFLTYWKEHSSLSQQGYPISNEFNEASEVDGKSYHVQYFERAAFELHPENQPSNGVLLSLLGNIAYKQKYHDTAPGQHPNRSIGSIYFPQTGKRLGGQFLQYWQQHGTLAQQGYPISDEFQEKSDLDGKTYTVQYFERAVFEYHSENQPSYSILLSQLGTLRFERKYPGGVPGAATPTPQADGWAALRQRPLTLPVLAAGGSCPVNTGKTVLPDFGLALGNGPIYAVGFGAEGVAYYGGSQQAGGWYYIKVLWVGIPSYKGSVLVRGHQIGGSNDLGFERTDISASPPQELKLHTDEGGSTPSGWNNWPSYTDVRAPGCYAYQVDGSDFTEVIVFRAANTLRP